MNRTPKTPVNLRSMTCPNCCSVGSMLVRHHPSRERLDMVYLPGKEPLLQLDAVLSRTYPNMQPWLKKSKVFTLECKACRFWQERITIAPAKLGNHENGKSPQEVLNGIYLQTPGNHGLLTRSRVLMHLNCPYCGMPDLYIQARLQQAGGHREEETRIEAFFIQAGNGTGHSGEEKIFYQSVGQPMKGYSSRRAGNPHNQSRFLECRNCIYWAKRMRFRPDPEVLLHQFIRPLGLQPQQALDALYRAAEAETDPKAALRQTSRSRICRNIRTIYPHLHTENSHTS